MHVCHRCQDENSELRRFCGACGALLVNPCRNCGFGNEPDHRFCGGCGKNLAESQSPSTPSKNPAASPSSDPGIEQLMNEVATEKNKEEQGEKFLDESDVESLFGDEKT